VAEKVDAWMPMHIGQYMAATGHLSTEEHGMYLLLLMHAWAAAGVIPGDPERVRRICRADPKNWARSCATILDFLTLQPDGTYRQKRLEAELVEGRRVEGEQGREWQERRSLTMAKAWQSQWRTDGGAISEAGSRTDGKGHGEPMPYTTTRTSSVFDLGRTNHHRGS
jgi:uncharacterized protein YdaU (DUF1376 family)